MPTTEPVRADREQVGIAAPVSTGIDDSTVVRSFDAFFTAEFPRLVRVALLIVGSTATAEEIVQEAFIRVYRRWDDIENPTAFARVCVVNGCRDRVRRRTRWRLRVPLVATEDSTIDDHDVGEDHELLTLVRGLPERQRTAIVLRYYEELTHAEIADALGLSQAAVKSLLHRALENIRKEMTP